MKFISQSRRILQEARNKAYPEEIQIRLGVSLMNPGNELLHLWKKIAHKYPHIHLSMVPFKDDADEIIQISEHLGEQIDIVFCCCVFNLWAEKNQSLYMAEHALCIAVPNDHPLSGKSILELRDLFGYTLYMSNPEKAANSIPVAEYLKPYPQIRIQYDDYTDYTTLSKHSVNKQLTVIEAGWVSMLPMAKAIPVEWDLTVPYGVFYSRHPSQMVHSFIQILKKEMQKS